MDLDYPMDDIDEPELTAPEIDVRVVDWLNRLTDVFGRIANWAVAHGFTVEDTEPVSMYEERMERAGVAAREQPSLTLRHALGERIWIRPKALFTIGANGRIDLFSVKGGIYVLIDIAEPLDRPHWILHKAGAGNGRPFDPELLAEMV